MPKYKKDINRKLAKDTRYVIPHGGDGEESSTVTIAEFKAGDSINFVKTEIKKVLKALGLDRTGVREYIKTSFNNFKDEPCQR